ncbi:MAG: hypothetical protein E6R13_00265 [Spirochaetes bacterium]|nr:MAG: hypothetical protein E6R13_00265 [Spirochaetota bacterium]
MADNTTNQDVILGALPDPNPMAPSSGAFTFEPVENLMLPPNTSEFTELMSPEYSNMLKRHAEQINRVMPQPTANLNDPNPSNASNRFNPHNQKAGLNLSTPEGKIAMIHNMMNNAKPTGETRIADPISVGIRETNFDRYYKHPKFAKLGWHPYANNEEHYNANSSFLDDGIRMFGQFGNLAGTGFVSAYRSIGDLFDDDDYATGMDLESAREFSDAMRIGNSTRGGVAGFTNNLVLQLGYTTGVIGSIAAEELALWGAAALQGGMNPVSDAAAVSRTGFNIARLGKTVVESFSLGRMANATRNMYRSLRSVDHAKDVWSGIKAGGSFVARGLAPETYQAIKTLNTTKNGVQGLSNMAKVSKTFGAFYRDARSLNLALAESKMEGGMVYDQQIANGYAYYSQQNNGQPLSTEQMAQVTDKAAKAAFWTTTLNAPTIYLSNQLLLGNAFGAYNKSLSRILGDEVRGVGRRIIKTQGLRDAAGKIVSRPFEYVGDGLRGYAKTLKAAGVQGSMKLAAQSSLRYFAANLSEGLQEVAQEAISHGTKHYHQALLEDPSSGGRDLLSGSIGSAVASQFNAQGFETFMTGFLMGGIAQGPQKLFFEGVPALYQRTFQNEKYQEYQKNKTEYINSLVNTLNDTYEITANDPMASLFDTNKINLTAQKQAGVEMLQAAFEQSNFDFVDAKDFSKFQAIYNVLSNNKSSEFKTQFEDYLKLSDDELAEAFPSSKKDIKSGKLRTRFQDMINNIDSLEDSYHENKDKFVNPFDPSIYKYGSREWNDEKLKQMSFEHARYLYMFTEDGFKRAVERANTIYNELAAEPIISNMAASDITVLLSKESIQKEIRTLSIELATLQDNKESKDIIAAKKAKLEGLNEFYEVLYSDENQNTKKQFDKRKINKLSKAFESYVQKLASSTNGFVNKNKVADALKKIVDHKTLSERAVAYDKTIEYLNNPERFDEITQRTYDVFKNIYKNRVEYFRNSIKNYISKIEINQFLNELGKLEVYPDPNEVQEFMDTGNIEVLQSFFTEKGIVNKISDDDIYTQIESLKQIYKAATTPTVSAEEEVTPDQKADRKARQAKKNQTDDILSEAGIENVPDAELFGVADEVSPVIKEVLAQKYKEYSAAQLNLGKKPMAMNSWLNSEKASNYVKTYEALKKLWYKSIESQINDQNELDRVYSMDEGFLDWLQSQETNDLVAKIFRTNETKLSDFVEAEPSYEDDGSQEPNVDNADISKPAGTIVDNTFNTVNIVKTVGAEYDAESESYIKATLYVVTDKKGKYISEEVTDKAGVSVQATYDNINKARSAAKKIDELGIDTTPFNFGGVTLSYGQTVVDNDGVRYMSIGTPAEVEKGKKLFLLPIDSIEQGQSKQQQHKLSKKVTEVEFKNNYKLESFNFTKVPSSASRLLRDAPVSIYAFENGFGTPDAEGIMRANARLQFILQSLTAEERSELKIFVKRNPNGGVVSDRNFVLKDEEGNWKEANPYIKKANEPFAVGIAFGSAETAARIGKMLDEKAVGLPTNAEGVFAYIPTGSIAILNEKKEVINPINITKDILENTFNIFSGQQDTALETVRKNFAIQQAFVNEIADRLGDSESGEFNLSEFTEFYVKPSSSVNIGEQNGKRRLSELDYNTVDGVRVIMVNDKITTTVNGKKKTTIQSTYITDIQDPEQERDFIVKMLDDIEKVQSSTFLSTLQAGQRYQGIIKLPNGQYAGAPLKAIRMSPEEMNEIAKEAVAQAVKTSNENLEGSGSVETKKIKDKNFNIEFNKAFNEKFYITTNIEGFDVEINLTVDGKLRLDVYDKENAQPVGTVYSASRQEVLDYANEENPNILENLFNKLQSEIDAAKTKAQAAKKKNPNAQIPRWTELKVSINNMRHSFSNIADVDYIEERTNTTLQKEVRSKYKLVLGATANVIKEAEMFAATTPSMLIDEVVEPQAIDSLETADEAYDSVLDMSDAVFEEYAKADFKDLTLQMKQQIANRLAKGEPLTEREERILKNHAVGNFIQMLRGNIERAFNVDSTKTALETELKQVRDEIKQIKADIDNSEPDMFKANMLKDENEEIKELTKRMRELERKLIANKIVTPELSQQDISDINEFTTWAATALPEFITIADINTLSDNLITNGVRVGAFALSLADIAGGMTVKGTIYTGAKSPYKYHEAFHGVFRSVLTNEQQDRYITIAKAELRAKLGNAFEEELEKFRNSADTYRAMSRAALEREFYEEYMADEFEKFKQNPRISKTSSTIKSFFNRLIEWIKAVFGRYSKNELQRLYKDIDAGKFKTASPIMNRFTESLETGISLNANKIIPVDRIESESGFGYRTLDNRITRNLVSAISARVINKELENKEGKFDLKQAVNESFVRFKLLYSTKREAYRYLAPQYREDLRDIEAAFEEFGDFIKDAVYEELKFYGIKSSNKQEENDEMIDQVGDRLGTTDQFDKDASMVGGFSSLPDFIRKYIGTTVLNESDLFGNEYLIDPTLDDKGNPIEGTGEKLMMTVDFAQAYNGLLKAVKNVNDPADILKQLYIFSSKNVQTKAVVDRLFNDLGITWEELQEQGIPESGIKNPLLFQAFVKGFENFKVDYLFIHRDTSDGVITYTAANRDDAHSQVDRWGQAYVSKMKDLKAKPEIINMLTNDKDGTLTDLYAFLSSDVKESNTKGFAKKEVLSVSDNKMISIAKKTSEQLEEYVGIKLSPQFIEFSIAKNLAKPSPYQKALINANKDEKVLDKDDVNQLRLRLKEGIDIFTDDKNDMASRLRKIALANAAFDETVGTSIFRNPNGDLVYAHQLPSFHLKEVNSLNDKADNGAKLEAIKESDDYLIKNFLLNSRAFKELSSEGRIKVLRIAGSKVGDIELDDNGLLNEAVGKNKTKGKTYGDSTPKEFILNLINSYIYAYNGLTGKIDGTITWKNDKGFMEEVAIAPSLIRVLEASNTGDMIALPVIKAVEKNSKGETVLTDEVLTAVLNNVEAEFNRIQRESNPETATQELLVGYNAKAYAPKSDGKLVTGSEEIVRIDATDKANLKNARAYNFHKTGVLLQPLTAKKESRQRVELVTSNEKFERIMQGNQGALLYDEKTASKYIGFTSEGVTRDALIKVKDTELVAPAKIYSRGKITVDPSNREEIFDLFKDSIQLVESDIYKYSFSVGNKTFWVQSDNERKFLQGKKAMYVYDIIQEEAESVLEEANLLISDFNREGYLDQLSDAARSAENFGLSFQEVLKKLGIKEDSLKQFIGYRLNQEYVEFNKTLDELLGKDGGLATFVKDGLVTSTGATTAETMNSEKLLNLRKDDQTYNLKQIFFNDYVNTTAINQILLGDSALTLKDAVDEIKRAKAQAASYYSAASVVAAPEYGITKPLQEFSIFEATEPLVESTHNEGNTKNADAQLWMTTKAFRYMQFGFGKLSAAQARLIDKIENGEEVSVEDIFGSDTATGHAKRQEMLNSQKLVYADGETFVKMSAFPLLPQFTSMKDADGNYTIPKPNKVALHNLRVKLEAFERENDTIAVSAPRSALKMLQKNVTNIHQLTATDAPLTKEQSVTLNANYMGLQVINPSNKLNITDPTQVKNLVTSEQDDNTEVVLNGKNTTIGAIRSAYHKATRDRGDLSFINKRNLVFTFDVDYAMDELHKSIDQNAITADLYTYLRYAEESLGSTGSAGYLMEFFSLNENGEQKYNLNNPLTYDKFMSLFMSYFSKSVFSEKVPGHTISLVSDYGVRIYRRVLSVDENGMPDKHEIITEAQYEAMANKPSIQFNIDQGSYPGNDANLNGLADAVKRSKGEGVVIVDRLRHNMKDYDANGKYTKQKYSEMILAPHHAEVMSKIQLANKSIPDVIGKMFAVRIPSQDNHSTMNVKWVDFMPAANGSSGVFSRELVEISGADFDIDKVYVQIKEFYEKNGEFFEYGKGETEEDRYNEYLKYVSKKIEDPSSVYWEALYKYKGSSRKTKSAQEDQGSVNQKVADALRVLRMPVTFEEYKAYVSKFKHEPYAAAINNDILDYKFALMGNDHVTERKPLFLDKNGNTTTVNTGKPALDEAGVQKTAVPISYEAADMVVLTDLWDELQLELPELAELVKEDGVDVDNMYGKLRMFANNKEGSRSIGAVVLPNLYLNLLQEFGIKVKSTSLAGEEITNSLEFAGIKYGDFGVTYEMYENGSAGQRTQYILSALITAATDNAKERLLAKLGLNINALSVVANLTALGVPIKTSILLINHPVVRYAYFVETNSAEGEIIKAKDVINQRIENLETVFLQEEDYGLTMTVNQDVLTNAIRNKVLNANAVEADMQKAREEGLVSKEDVIEEISILKQYLNAINLAETTRYMGDLINLNNGLGQSLDDIDRRNIAIEKLGLNLTDKEFEQLGDQQPIINTRSIFLGDTWQAGYLERFLQFSNTLLPKVALSASPLFRAIINNITDSTNLLSDFSKREFKQKLTTDFLSYLTIKAYQHNMMSKNPQSVATLTNGLIYDQDGVENIVDVVDRLRALDPDGLNYFLNSFIIAESSNQKDNKTGLNLAGSNTFLRYNDSQKIDIQNGFIQLYADSLTRRDAMALVHYMMVKDGLQYAYKSLVEAVAPIALDNYLNQIDTVEAAMMRPTDSLFESTFGTNLNDMIVDFTQGYLAAPITGQYVKRANSIPTYRSKGVNAAIETKAYTKDMLNSNPEKVFVFGDNAAKEGSDGNRSVRNFQNAFGLTYKKSLSIGEEFYYSSSELSEFAAILDSQIANLEELMKEGKTIILPEYIIPKTELANIKKYSPDVYKYMNDKLKNAFGYELDVKKGKKVLSGKGSSTKILSRPAYMDLTGETGRLYIDLYKGLLNDERLLEKVGTRDIPATKNIKDQASKVLLSNIKALKAIGFQNVNVSKNNLKHQELVLPLIIKVNTSPDPNTYNYKYFALDKTQSLLPGTGLLNSNGKAVGSYAEYVEVSIMGSTAQNPIGFMFGERPTYLELKDYIKNVSNSTQGDAYDYGDMNYDSYDVDMNSRPGVVLPENADVVATNKGIAVNGMDISNLVGQEPSAQTTEEVDIPEDASFDFSQFEGNATTADFFSSLLGQTVSLNDKYPDLVSWWDENVDDPFSDAALSNRKKLKQHRDNPDMKFDVSDLDDFLKLREDSQFFTDEEFVEHFKNCYL